MSVDIRHTKVLDIRMSKVHTVITMKTLTPTPLNVYVLGRIANGRREFPNRVTATSSAHLRRCMKAGLVDVVDRTRLRITDVGYVALVDAIATRGEKFPIPDGEYTTQVCE